MGQRQAEARYRSAHWGIDPTRVVEVVDDRLPAYLVEMGKLREIVVDPEDGTDDVLNLEFTGNCVLAFSDCRAERLFCVLTPAAQGRMRRLLWAPKAPTYPAADVAGVAGGRQARYPVDLGTEPIGRVKVVGRITDVVYHTEKRGDGPSLYHHEVGEESGIRPYLGVTSDGALWWLGGNYSVPDAGVVD